MEVEVYFFFNVMIDQDDELKLTNQSSYFYEALNNQTHAIRNYAARKGIPTRNQPAPITTIHQTIPTPTAGKTTHSITISDDDDDDDDDELFINKPTS